MKATPLLFKAEMIQALLREIDKLGTGKTMTRRTMKPQPQYIEHPDCTGWYWESPKKIDGFNPVESWQDSTSKEWLSEFIGDRYSPYGRPGDLIWCKETFASTFKSHGPVCYRATESGMHSGPWKPSIFMYKWVSRITLLIEDVRVERLQNISRGDCMSEGCPFPNLNGEAVGKTDPVGWFSDLWKSINGEESWSSNPYVWVIEFRPILANVDAVVANPEMYGIGEVV